MGIKATAPVMAGGPAFEWDHEADCWHVQWCNKFGGFPIGVKNVGWVNRDGELWRARSRG